MRSDDTPELLVAGHVVQDLVGDGGDWRLGGAAAYSALLGQRFGLRTAVLTSCAADVRLGELLPGIEFAVVESAETTQFRNVYRDGHREQWVPRRASQLTADHLPDAWRDAAIVLLGPVAGEVDESLARTFAEGSLVGVGAQGLLRQVGPDSRVRPVSPSQWDAARMLANTDALFLSDEDLPVEDAPGALAEWSSLVDVLAFTRGYDGADVCYRGEWRRIDALPANPVDLTGAGDVFATGFLVRYRETGDPAESARFGSAAASLVIEGEGVDGVPTREMVEERLSGSQAGP